VIGIGRRKPGAPAGGEKKSGFVAGPRAASTRGIVPPLTIWTNTLFQPAAERLLAEGLGPHRLVRSAVTSAAVLAAGRPDPALAGADVAFGQPDAAQCLASPRLRWVEVTTAGYTRYDTPEFLEGFRARGAAFTNASQVFADSCAQHVLAMMLALGRRLLPSHREQLTDRSWHYDERRYESRLLTGQSVLLLGYGAIGRRLAALLAPFGMQVTPSAAASAARPGSASCPRNCSVPRSGRPTTW